MSSGVKSQVTVVACVSVGGQCLPPMVIKMFPPEGGARNHLWSFGQGLD